MYLEAEVENGAVHEGGGGDGGAEGGGGLEVVGGARRARALDARHQDAEQPHHDQLHLVVRRPPRHQPDLLRVVVQLAHQTCQRN